jgi:type IV pilus assembly protein PilY1
VLLVQYLDGDKSIKKVSPCGIPVSAGCSFKGTNGLSSPQLIDINGDGKVDVAYVGDLKGNLWKFNLTGTSDSSWSTSFSGQPFFVAKGHPTASARPAATVQQAITTAPYWMPHPLGGILVSVGTGRNLTDSDRTSSDINTYYGLWDKSTFSTSGASVTITDGSVINTTSDTVLPTTTGGLVQQTITPTTISENGTTYYASSNNPVDYSTKRGWYLDLALPDISGERVLINTRPFSGDNIVVTTTVPRTGSNNTGETCTPKTVSDANFLYVLNMRTGNQPDHNIFVETFGKDKVIANIVGTGGGDIALVNNGDTKQVVQSETNPDCPGCLKFDMGNTPGRRANWRQKN